MVVSIDLRTWSSSRSVVPSQVQGPVAPTPRSELTCLGAPKPPSERVSTLRPLVWPSVWQLWQLIQPSCESRASANSRSPRSTGPGSGRGPSGIVRSFAPDSTSTTVIESSSESAT